MYEEKRINQLEGSPNYAERLNCIFHGEDKKKIMYQLIPRVMQTGRLFAVKDNIQVDGKVCNISAYYSHEPYIALQLTCKEVDGSNLIHSFQPSALGGARLEITITNIQEYESGFEAVITGELKNGALTISFFDTNYFEHKDEIKIGDKREFLIAAYAYEAGVKELEINFIKVERAVREEMSKLTNVDIKDIPSEIDMSKTIMFVQYDKEAPEDGEFISTVTGDVDIVQVAGRSLYNILITLWQDPNNAMNAVVVPLFARTLFFDKKPKLGDPINGAIWLLGRTRDH